MKKLLSLVLLICSYFISQSQIANTSWATYNPSIFDSVFVTVTNDSIIQVDGNSNHLVSNWYDENGDTVRILDATGPFRCPNPDTGWYRYTIAIDTLTIILLHDSCITRAQAYDGVVLQRIKTPTGIVSISKDKKARIYSGLPGSIQIDTYEYGVLDVFNLNGQLIRRENIMAGKTTISIPSGMYVTSFKTDIDVSVSRALVQ